MKEIFELDYTFVPFLRFFGRRFIPSFFDYMNQYPIKEAKNQYCKTQGTIGS